MYVASDSESDHEAQPQPPSDPFPPPDQSPLPLQTIAPLRHPSKSTRPRHCSNCGKSGTLSSHCDCSKIARQHSENQAYLFKQAKITGTITFSVDIGTEHVDFQLPVQHAEFLAIQKRLDQNSRDRVRFHVDTVASHLNKKRRAAELELEMEDKELEEQRHKEDLARHERRAKAMRRAAFGDDAESQREAPAEHDPTQQYTHTQPASSFSIGGAGRFVYNAGRAMAGGFSAAAVVGAATGVV